MGCTTSDHDWQNILIVRNISADNKQKISDAIQMNDLINLALLMQDIQAYPNSEISQPKMGWMLTHLCCRWDANLCLQYLLRLYFMQNPKGYLTFVNAQTAQGYTCLHLCCIWNSMGCFEVLNKLGGLDLTIKDNKLKTAQQQANQYKCNTIAKILQQYKKQKIQFTYISTQNLIKDPLIKSKQKPLQTTNHTNNMIATKQLPQIPQKQTQQKLQKQHSQQQPKLALLTQHNHNKQFQQKQTKLLSQKSKLQTQLSILLKQKLQKQLEYDTKITLIYIFLHIQQYQKQQYTKKQRQKLNLQLEKQIQIYIKQIEIKQQSIKLINLQLKNIEKQKLNYVKNLSQAKIEEVFLKNNIQLNQKIKQKNNILLEYKNNNLNTQKIKQLQSKTLHKIQGNIINKNSQIPQNILKLYEETRKSGMFIDIQFPASNKSIGDSTKSKYTLFTENTIWMRPKEIFKQDFKLFNGIDPDDIKQGSLGVCYMLATISALAANPKNIQKIFVFADIQIGFYVLKLFVNGVPKYFVVDDLIPCCKTTKSPYFTQPIGKQIWVLLLEKAWAKLIGSYLSAESMTPDHMMEDLSGAPAYGWWLSKQNVKTPTQKIKQIIKHCSLGYIVVITSVADKKIQGIVNNHAYSLLGVIQYNNRYIFKIRNPWGRFQWDGQFGENSSLCTEDFKKTVQFKNKDDGIFFISENQLLKAFCFYSISHIKPDYFYSYIKFQSKKNQNVYFRFKLKKSWEVNLRIVQPFDRIINNRNYKYSPMLFQIGKIINKNQMIFISEGHQRTYFGAKSVHAFQDIFQFLQQGQYFVRIKMLWDWEQKFNSAVLGCYAGQQVCIQQIQKNQGDQLLKSLFFAFMKPYNKIRLPNGYYKIATMKGQFLFLAQTQPQLQQQFQYKVTFKFNKQKMVNTETEIGKIGPTEMETIIDKKRYGICTALRIQPAQGGTTGPVSITFTKI